MTAISVAYQKWRISNGYENKQEVAGDLTLRKATSQDFDAIRDIALRSRMAALSHFITEDEVEDEVKLYYSDDVLNGILNNPNNVIYVVEKGSQMVGHGSVLLQDRRGNHACCNFMCDLAINV